MPCSGRTREVPRCLLLAISERHAIFHDVVAAMPLQLRLGAASADFDTIVGGMLMMSAMPSGLYLSFYDAFRYFAFRRRVLSIADHRAPYLPSVP